MQQYHDLLTDILANGETRVDRTGVGTIGVFGRQVRYDLRQGFPLVTTKRMFTKAIIHELLWFLMGSSNIKYLVDNGVSIWSDWPHRYYNQQNPDDQMSIEAFEQRIREDAIFASVWGECGPIYGRQWRGWKGLPYSDVNGFIRRNSIDQMTQVMDDLRKNRFSRRHIVSAWNPEDTEEMAKAGLPPCHCLFHFYVSNNNELSCLLYQRSCDTFLGVPFNIASYALLTHMIAHVLGYGVGEFIHTLGDTHIYLNHQQQVAEQLSRTPLPLPTLWLNPKITNLFDFNYDDIVIQNYQSHPAIKAPIAV